MNIIIMILLISVLVLVHEIGHYIAARICGVRVPQFGIGLPIGPSWKMFRWNNTDFYLHAFIFGGYVMFPDDISENDKDKNNKEEKIPENELYENKRISQKLFIVTAGVLMNAIFAIILVMFCAWHYQKLPSSNQDIFVEGFADKVTSNIRQLGIQKGDKFVRMNGSNINTYYQLAFFIKNSKLFDDYAQENLIAENLSELKKLNPNIQDTIRKGQKIYLPEAKDENPLNVNRNILKGLEKYKKDGVKLTQEQIDLRNDIYNLSDYVAQDDISLKDVAIALSDTKKPLSITVLRGDKEITFENVDVDPFGFLGLKLKVVELYTPTKTFSSIVTKSFEYTYKTTASMLFSLWQLVSGKVSATDMHGVIAIVKIGGDVIASKGMLNGLLLTAMISLNLAIMNLLPIPALDGGHVMFLIIEKITGRKPTKEVSEKLNNFFFILLIFLLLAICYNDIYALITKKF